MESPLCIGQESILKVLVLKNAMSIQQILQEHTKIRKLDIGLKIRILLREMKKELQRSPTQPRQKVIQLMKLLRLIAELQFMMNQRKEVLKEIGKMDIGEPNLAILGFDVWRDITIDNHWCDLQMMKMVMDFQNLDPTNI